jgi:hypothetical protein
LSTQEVYQEVSVGADDLAKWCTTYRKARQLFVKQTKQQVGIAKQIIHRFPDLIDIDRPGSQADPILIALAYFEANKTLAQHCVVVTDEKYTPFGRKRIPHVCASYKLPYLSIHQMYVAEGWDF